MSIALLRLDLQVTEFGYILGLRGGKYRHGETENSKQKQDRAEYYQ
jgi:hypothetical protein